MPPLQDSCILARGACTMSPSTSGRVDGTAAILAKFYTMSIREDCEEEGPSSKGTTSQDRTLDCSSEDKDVASLTSAVQSINLASSTAVHDTEGPAASHVGSQDAKCVSSSKDIEDAKCVSSSKDIEDAKSIASSKDIEDAESTASSKDIEDEVNKKSKMISRGPIRKRTQVYSRDRQTGGLVFTYNNHTPVQDTSLALPAHQWWTEYREPPQQFYCELSNVDGSGSDELLPEILPEATSSLTVLAGEEVEKFLDGLINEALQSGETDDDGLPPSPESLGSVSSPSYSNPSSVTSGLGSPCGSLSILSPECSSLPSSPGQVYTPSMSPPHHKPIRPKARPAREIILECITKAEKEEACLKINLASEEKLMRSSDVDGDTNLTVLVRYWEQHKRPMALLYAMVERMKFIKNGLSKKTLKGENALCLAAMFAHADPLVARYIAEVMVEYGEEINEVDGNGNNMLHSLCWKGDSHIHVLQELLSINKFDVNHANQYGETPLRVACSKGAVQMVVTLLSNGAKPDQPKNGVNLQGEPLILLSPDQMQEVERLFKERAWQRYAH